jgi:hypothetical protein
MHYTFENQDFCKQWKTNAQEDDYQYCRKCTSQPCQQLWELVKKLASANNCNGTQAKTLTQRKPFRIYTTLRQGVYYCNFQSLAEDRKGRDWGIPKEDFLYVLKTGDDHTPSDARQKSHVEPIIEIIRTHAHGQELINQVLKT